MIDYKSLKLGAIDSGVVVGAIKNGSGLMKLGREVALLPTGTSVSTVSGVKAFGVGEGKAKTASGANSSVIVGANKAASVVVETDEVWENAENVARAILEEQPQSVANLFDAVATGLVAMPADWTNFGTLAASQEVEIGTGDAASVDLDDAQALLTNGVANGILATTSMLAYLKRQRVASTGARVFEIEGNSFEGTIDGIPYYTISSNEKWAYIGDFSKFVYGSFEFNRGDEGSAYRVKDQGNITDDAGVTHNLTTENKVAVFYERFVGAGVLDSNAFAKLTVKAETPGEEGGE